MTATASAAYDLHRDVILKDEFTPSCLVVLMAPRHS